MKLKHLLLCGCMAFSIAAFSNPVIVKMNAETTTMTLAEKTTGKPVEITEPPVNREYNLDLKPGDYILTGISQDGKTVNGSIVVNVADSITTQQITVITCTAYVSNKNDDNESWTIDSGDYTLDVKVNSKEGERKIITTGESRTKGRYTFLALNGNSYNVAFIPSEEHQKEGYMTLYRGGTLTSNVNVTGKIPFGGEFEIEVPSDAALQLGIKFTHFTDFTEVEPTEKTASEGGTIYRYRLADGQVYNYRTWKDGGLTHGGYFTMYLDESKRPDIKFRATDYAKHDPKAINHDVNSNNGYETGDIFLNINPEGHLKLKEGEEYLVHAMRTWELSDNSTNNYFIEPDFHYTILDTNFRPQTGVIEIENKDTHTSAWSKLRAVGEGTSIVLVRYDGINLNYYNNADKKDYLGGEYWGAIWPENTGVFVVTVGEDDSKAVANMVVNEQYNVDALRLAGKYVDAEHDVFYYLDTEEGFKYTFVPENVETVSIANPVITNNEVSYSGFTTQGITKNPEGEITVILKEGRNIVRMTDASGKSIYQILNAKPCHREIMNVTRPGGNIYQPGDQIKIQYSGLFHPANKIAGIYNMSAYVTYNGTPNGSSLILGAGQYIFGSAPSAQAVTVDIPDDYDVEEKPEFIMDEGVIQVNGYGDPIGNHRNTSHLTGRSPNFTAVPHKTYFGSIPDIRLNMSPLKLFNIKLLTNVEDTEVSITFRDNLMEADENGLYSGTYGEYSVVAKKKGFRCYRGIFTIAEGAAGDQLFDIVLEEGREGMWDGESISEIAADENGVYHVATGAELAYIQSEVAQKGKDFTATVVLDKDIDLGNFEWNPIGDASKTFSGNFDGNGYTITGLYVDKIKTNNVGLFGYLKGTAEIPASVSNLPIEGEVKGKQYVGGIAGNINAYASISKCANMSDVTGTSSYVGGIVGNISSPTETSVSNCYNHGNIAGTTNVGGVIGYNNASATIENIYSIGKITGTTANALGACVGSTASKDNVKNAFAIAEYGVTNGHILVSEEQMASGEVAYKLGVEFNQTIGEDEFPTFNGLKVFYDDENDVYYNNAVSFTIGIDESDNDIEMTEDGVSLPLKEYGRLVAIANPKAARLPEISWNSSDAETVEISEEGMIRALKIGKAVVTATGMIDEVPYAATCNVNVIPAPVVSLKIEAESSVIDLKHNDSLDLKATYSPEYAEMPELKWSSSDETILNVEDKGNMEAMVIGMAEGAATVTVELKDNADIYDTCEIIVTNSSSIESIMEGENDMKVSVFDLSGVELLKDIEIRKLNGKLSNGLYLIVSEKKSWKVFVK